MNAWEYGQVSFKNTNFPGLSLTEGGWHISEIPGLIHREEEWFLAHQAEEMVEKFGPKIVIVNIGVFVGLSCYWLRIGARGAHLYGVDIRTGPVAGTPEQVELLNLDYIRGSSAEVHKDFQEQIHLLFVDGCHEYPAVYTDIDAWCPKVVAGGRALFHDAVGFGWSPPIAQAIDERMPKSWEEQPPLQSIRWFVKRG